MLTVVHISDTHNQHDNMSIPDGDILIHTGDATGRGTFQEIEAFEIWFRSLPARLLVTKSKIHLCGHIHEANGVQVVNGITYSNAAMLNVNYRPTNNVNVFEVHKDGTILPKASEV